MKTYCLALFGISFGLIFGWHTSAHAAKSYNYNCPSGYVLVGIVGNQGSWMNLAAGRCAKVKSDGAIGKRDRKNIKLTKWAGGKAGAGDRTRSVNCPANMVMVGFTGSTGTYVNAITSVTCQNWNKSTRTTSGRVSNISLFPIKGKGTYSHTLCKGGTVGLGITGKHGMYLDRFRVKCGLAPRAKPATTAASPSQSTIGTVKKSSGGRRCVPANLPCPSGTICRRC